MKMLESSDIECSSDDDDPDWELPERHVAAADDEEEQSQADLDDAADTIAQTSACATQSAPSGKYIWKEEPFEEKSLPSLEYDLSEPPSNVRTPLEHFSEYFDDSSKMPLRRPTCTACRQLVKYSKQLHRKFGNFLACT